MLLENFPRAVIEGGAGTGKTLLALEMAARLAESGRKVCLTCFNNPIAEWMKERLASLPQITVGTFHGICGKLVNAAGMECRGHGEAFYDTELPSLAVKAMEEIKGSDWDVVLVDEGQDFRDDWWQAIESMLPKDGTGILRVFYDSNQMIYRKPTDVASKLEAQTFTLKYNLRNTKAISRITDFLYRGPQIFAIGPAGDVPVTLSCNYTESWAEARSLVVRLIKEENLNLGDIAVLVSGEAEAVKFRSELTMLRIASAGAEQLTRDSVTVDSIKRFKGLESLVVILIINRNMANEPQIAYVAVSRAKTRLYILGNIAGTVLDSAIHEASKSKCIDG